MSINKVVFPIAGFGTRLLPITKSLPKEMLPIIDKPLIQYSVEEATNAGFTELIFITNKNSNITKDYFSRNMKLENYLLAKNQKDLCERITSIIPSNVYCYFINQEYELGLGHAILCAKERVKNDPFAVILPDDIIKCKDKNCLQQLLAEHNINKSSNIAIEPINYKCISSYGIAEYETPSVYNKISKIIEKPKLNQTKSNMAVVGRYIFNPDIIYHLKYIFNNSLYKNQLQLADAINLLIKQQAVFGVNFIGKRFDCGSKKGYVEAILEYAKDANI